MKTFLIVMGGLIGFIALVVGGLVFLWFYQGGCCVRRIKNKLTRKDYAAPVFKEKTY
ncbi:MAG: hypothetical protein WCC06_00170 [Candidatus Aminicenantales bacterium]